MISSPEGLETQLALLSSDASDEAQTERLRDCTARSRDFYAKFPQLAQLPTAFRVDPLPARITLRRASALPPLSNVPPHGLVYGVGGDELARMTAAWESISGFVVAGARGSGRSTLLSALLHQLHERGHRSLVVSPRPSTLGALAQSHGVALLDDPTVSAAAFAELVDQLEAHHSAAVGTSVTTGPVTLIIDDAELLAHTPLEQAITAVASRVSIVVAVESESVSSLFGSALTQAKRHRQGVVLSPAHSMVGTGLFGTPIPKSMIGARSPGRGAAFVDEQWVPMRAPEAAHD